MKPLYAFVLAATLVGCAARASAEYDPFHVSRERFAAENSTIAVAPPRLHEHVGGSEEETADRLVAAIAKALRGTGYAVVAPEEYEARWGRHARTLGGVFDPTTGAADEEAFRLAYEYTARDLSADLGVDAILRPSVYRRSLEPGWARAPRGSTWATHDELFAAGEPVLWGGEITRRGVGDDTPESWPQLVMGRWLGIRIQDPAGLVLYEIGCSIGWETVYMHRGFEQRPPEEIFLAGRLETAVERCLRALDVDAP